MTHLFHTPFTTFPINDFDSGANTPACLLTGLPYTRGSTTTNTPHFYFKPRNVAAPTSWHASGTIFGSVTPTSFAGNIVDYKNTTGTSIYSLDTTGKAAIRTVYGYGDNGGDQLGDGILLVHPSVTTGNGGGVQIWDSWVLHWRGVSSTGLSGYIANTLEIRGQTTTNAQTVRIYNTWTSSTNYETGVLAWTSNIFQVGTQAGSGGGNYRDLQLITNNTSRVSIDGTTGNTTFNYPVIYSSTARLKGYTVETLPTGTRGDTAFVTDALAPSYLVAVVGGGAIITPVFYNGTNWVCN